MRPRFAFVALLLLLLVSCTRTTVPRYDRIYTGRSEPLPRLDPTILDGRRIVIDPGHGGAFPGTLGQDGTAEAHVNLGVALYLWGLCREAGADVHLTRTAERDFLLPEDSTLVTDLQSRVDIADTLRPDIFVSIHHNAQPARDPAKNAVETYYRFGDPASRDLAFAVHRHLMRNLGIRSGEVRPGNYFVLRNLDVPAILGESSYLTHPPVEDNLKLSSKQRLEAEAYFLGILEYFSRGTPKIAPVHPIDSVYTHVPTLDFHARDIGGLGIDPAAISVTLNEEPLATHLGPGNDRLRCPVPWDAPNGRYEIALSARNILGNTSPVVRAAFRLELPPVHAVFVVDPDPVPRDGGTIRLRVRLLDARGTPVADGTQVRLEAADRRFTVRVRDGIAEFGVPTDPSTDNTTLVIRAGATTFPISVERAAAGGASLHRLSVVDANARRPLRDARIVVGDSLITDHAKNGSYFIGNEILARSPVKVTAPGYRPARDLAATATDGGGTGIDWARATPDTVALAPWFDGVLLHKRFVLDPEGGFGESTGMGPLGLSGAFVNLHVARYLAEYLRAAGAHVVLTRETEQTLTARDIVAVTNRFGADRYIEIRHRALRPDSGLFVQTYHFPGSRNGEATANAVQRVASDYLGLPVRPARDTVTFPLQQTACPAIVVEMPSIAVLEEEIRLAEPWYQRRQAYALFQGVLAHFGWEPTGRLVVEVESAPGEMPDNWLLRLDDTWELLSGPDGRATFAGLAERPYRIEGQRRGLAARHATVDLRSGARYRLAPATMQ